MFIVCVTHSDGSAAAAGLHQSVRQQQRRVGLVSEDDMDRTRSQERTRGKGATKREREIGGDIPVQYL